MRYHWSNILVVKHELKPIESKYLEPFKDFGGTTGSQRICLPVKIGGRVGGS